MNLSDAAAVIFVVSISAGCLFGFCFGWWARSKQRALSRHLHQGEDSVKLITKERIDQFHGGAR